METTTKLKAGTQQTQNVLVIQRVFDLPVQAVWTALTESESFKHYSSLNNIYKGSLT